MSVQLIVPEIGESITEAFVGKWLKSEGQHIAKDEIVAELESEKANFELPAPVSGTLTKIFKQAGESAKVSEAIGLIEEDGGSGKQPEQTQKQDKSAPVPADEQDKPEEPAEKKTPQAKPAEPSAPVPKNRKSEPAPAEASDNAPPRAHGGDREEEAVAMSPMRKTIAKRLVAAQHEAALLTTFNEIDVSEVIDLRNRLREEFQKQYGVKLGFMSFFVKAAVDALKRFPVVNARVDGDKIVYHNYQDIGVAVSTDRGLVVPVLRNADRMSFAQIERSIGDMAERAAQGKLDPDDLRGGTFTITNGGVFGSLMSTPIVKPPQSAVLGMHAILDRPIAIEKQVVVRPMMYLALTYDHRIIDGKEAVSFLKRIKEAIEQPARMFIEA